jgi:hypothetical protein
MFYVRVANFHELVLLGSFHEYSMVPLISRLLFENGMKFFLGVFYLDKWGALIHTFFPNPAVPCEHDVKLAVGVVDHLHLVEGVVAVEPILEIHLSHVRIVGPPVLALSFKVYFVLLLAIKTSI